MLSLSLSLSFGLTETPGETFESCAAKVVECLQGTVPNKVWSEDDIVRAHRVGKKPDFASVAANRNQNAKPRPMIVKFTRWKDKMAILTKARPALKQKRIDVAGDLTQRQHEQIRLHRDKGVRAYYKGNKLVVAGPLQQRINDDTDNSSQRRFDISNNNNNSQAVKYWKIPLVTAGALSSDFANKDRYPMMTRIGPNFNSLVDFIVNVLKQFRWRRVTLMYDAEGQGNIVEKFCHIAANGIHYGLK
nr:hypothetical protein BaRGS_000061 [Batillaria attramentaria]